MERPRPKASHVPSTSSVDRRSILAGAGGIAATAHPFGPDAIAHQLFDGPIVVADPDAPIEYGCRVLLTLTTEDAKFSHYAFEGRCETKHPAKAKWGITVSFKNFDGTDAGGFSRCPLAGSKRCVFRIVAE